MRGIASWCRRGLMVGAWVLSGGLAAQAGIIGTERGARVETDRYSAEFRDGVLVSWVNRLTGEEYLDPDGNWSRIRPHLPAGLGTQATEAEREAAYKLYLWPWWEHPATATWSCHHVPFPESRCVFESRGEDAGTITYTGLTDGSRIFPDETLALDLAVDSETGDLLVTPKTTSPRPGVFSSSLVVGPLAPAVTAEAPIFDGIRLDRAMKPALWINQWAGYWDYAFLALNGRRRGAVAVWAEDADLSIYKYLHYLVNDEGLTFSFTAFNVPPFEGLKEAGTVTWRLQAFEKGWPQAVARYRSWRERHVRIAPRPSWANQISFVNGGVNAAPMWLEHLENYIGSEFLSRTITFAATIRAERFDVNHANNVPYADFREHMKAWKAKGPKLMAYLQPMIMWSPNPQTEREKKGVEASRKATTITVFQKPGEAKPVSMIDQHHLGEPEWQRWFLDWVREYIQDYGADAVYHDQSYHCPVDVRGRSVAGMTSPQGMADYFYKAQSENPQSLHGTEHLTEVNVVGASLGIGSGILWGTAESMRRRRIDHPSPICNALHWPYAALYSFPHFSGITAANLERIHWGMNLSEGRGELPYAALQSADAARTNDLVNERWMDVVRSHTFVRKGLRAIFPEEWDWHVVSYFRGAHGEEVRYIRTDWGSAFVEITGGHTNPLYGRIHGTPYARASGGIFGWPFYNADGPAGLHPRRFYVLDPNLPRPPAYLSSNNQFSPSLYEGYVEEGYVDDTFLYAVIKAREEILNIIQYDSVILHAPSAPKAVYVNGSPVQPTAVAPGQWQINFQLVQPVAIVVFLKDPLPSLEQAAEAAVTRVVGRDWAMDQYIPRRGLSAAESGAGRYVAHVVFQAPTEGDGLAEVDLSAYLTLDRIEFNGVAVPHPPPTVDNYTARTTIRLPLKAGQPGLLTLWHGGRPSLQTRWTAGAKP